MLLKQKFLPQLDYNPRDPKIARIVARINQLRVGLAQAVTNTTRRYEFVHSQTRTAFPKR
jgi:hypothetical protein